MICQAPELAKLNS